MHVIVGQGQLDSVLSATPEDRRGFIEEAAGVLKHRKRKEKALRKLDAMEANLVRLTDLTAELRRQLKPLGRQAEVAQRAGVIQADVRDARLRLLADDLGVLPQRARAGDRRRERAAEALRRRGARLRWPRPAARDRARARGGGHAARSHRRPGDLVPARRARATGSVGSRRWRRSGCGSPPSCPTRPRLGPRAGGHGARGRRDPRAGARAGGARSGRDRAVTEPGRAAAARGRERAVGRGGARIAALLRAIADRREGMARLAGQVAAARTTVEAAAAERERLESVAGRGAPASGSGPGGVRRARVPDRRSRRGRGRPRLRVRGGVAGVGRRRRSGLPHCARTSAPPSRSAPRWSARKEALELGLDRKDGSGGVAGRHRSGLRPARFGRRDPHHRAGVRGGGRRRRSVRPPTRWPWTPWALRSTRCGC